MIDGMEMNLLTGQFCSFNFEDYKAFFEADDNDDFTITSPRNEKSENTTTGSAASGETTPRVGRNPLLNQPTAQYYDESEDYEDKTDFRVKQN